MSKIHLKLYTMVGKKFETYLAKMSKNHLKLSNMFGDIFDIHVSQMSQKLS